MNVTSSPVKPETEAEAEDTADRRLVAQPSAIRAWLLGNGTWVLALDVLLVIVFSILSPNGVFFTAQNFQFLLLGGSELLLISLGMTLLLAAGQFDLSVGANLVLSSVVGANVMIALTGTSGSNAVPEWLAIVLGVLAAVVSGVIYGLVNGLLIGVLRVNSLIATLGTLGVGTGVALLITNGTDVGGLPPSLQTGFGLARIGPFPLPAVVAIGLAVLLWLAMRYTQFGLRVISLGSSTLATSRAGLSVRNLLIRSSMIVGLLCGIAGVIDIAHFGSTTVSGHSQDALSAITAAVIGGTALQGGRINVPGTVWGTGLATILLGGLVVIGVPSFWQVIATGVVLVAAVAIDRYRNRSSIEET